MPAVELSSCDAQAFTRVFFPSAIDRFIEAERLGVLRRIKAEAEREQKVRAALPASLGC